MNQAVGNQLIGKINAKKLNWKEKKAICEQWKQSGKSRAEFCKEQELSFQTFWGWCDRLWPRSNKKTKLLTPVKIINKTAPVEDQTYTIVEINLPNQSIIRFKLSIKQLSLFIQEMSHAS